MKQIFENKIICLYCILRNEFNEMLKNNSFKHNYYNVQTWEKWFYFAKNMNRVIDHKNAYQAEQWSTHLLIPPSPQSVISDSFFNRVHFVDLSPIILFSLLNASWNILFDNSVFNRIFKPTAVKMITFVFSIVLC